PDPVPRRRPRGQGTRPLERARRARGDRGGEPAMIRVALRGLAGRKLRTALTMLAVVLGVAMVSGTYVFTDTIEKAIDTLLTDAYTGSDAVVSARGVVDLAAGERPTVPARLAADVRALPEVAAVSGA